MGLINHVDFRAYTTIVKIATTKERYRLYLKLYGVITTVIPIYERWSTSVASMFVRVCACDRYRLSPKTSGGSGRTW